MKKKLAFILIDITQGEYPLVPACLSGYARLDPEIKEYWDFEHHTYLCNTVSLSQLETDMQKIDADVYAFSCYVWNMGMIKQVIQSYPKNHPHAHIMLGGPQTAHQGKKYLNEAYENVVICNGEGEVIFRNYLKELMNQSPDFNKVKGLSFYQSKNLITTADEAPIKNLDEIPSPFCNELFKINGFYTLRMETNRNCPFNCKYCYWGNKGTKPTMFSLERVKADILEIARKRTPRIHITDANFGLFGRDVEITEFIAQCKKDYGFPEMLIFPPPPPGNDQHMSQICKTLLDAGIDFTYEIGLQSLSANALQKINKKYIYNDYLLRQNFLNENKINSRIDLIWPLPGETVDSFRKGIAKLCKAKADTIIFLPLLLLNNTALQEQKEEYGLVTQSTKDITSEEEFVVQTNEVSFDNYIEGLQFSLASFILYNLRSLYLTGQYLNDSGIEPHDALISEFSAFVMSHENMPAHFSLKSLSQTSTDWFTVLARISFDACHDKRDVFDQWLFQFVSSRTWWNDKSAQLYFEADLLNRGNLYRTQVKPKLFNFQHLRIADILSHGYMVEIPPDYIDPLNKMIGPKALFNAERVEVNHLQSQSVFDENASMDLKLGYSFRMTMFNYNYLPSWR